MARLSARLVRADVLVAAGLSVAFLALVWPTLDAIFWDYDEGYYMLDARHVGAGLRPYRDFPYHQPPLYLYLLALSGKLFGPTIFGFRVLSLASMAASGFLLFWLARVSVGPLPALTAQAFFLFSQSQIYALSAVPEPPTVFFTLVGAACLFLGTGGGSACLAATAFVIAMLLKPTCLLMVAAAAASLALAGAWRRLAHLTAGGILAAVAALAWTIWLSDGIFADVLRLQLERVSTQRFGMWSIDSGFSDLRQQLGIETPRQWALFCLKNFYIFPETYVPMVGFLVSFAGIPVWMAWCGRDRAVRAFSVLWPASYLLANFVLIDFVSDKYFVPFLAFSAFLVAGLVWLVERRAGSLVTAATALVACAVLVVQFAAALERRDRAWFLDAARLGSEHAAFVSFTPMLFAVTGATPGCGMDNPAFTYEDFGRTFLVTDRLERFRYSDARLVECLRAEPRLPVVVDWAFYYFTRPGSSLREYLNGEGRDQRYFFSAQAAEQWDRPDLMMPPG
jgi:4-amino-4-deoxy-L-arabinose transferase-like glycosyltransferase